MCCKASLACNRITLINTQIYEKRRMKVGHLGRKATFLTQSVEEVTGENGADYTRRNTDINYSSDSPSILYRPNQARTDDVDTVSPRLLPNSATTGGCISSIQSAGGQFRLKYDVVWFVRGARRPGLLASRAVPTLKKGLRSRNRERIAVFSR